MGGKKYYYEMCPLKIKGNVVLEGKIPEGDVTPAIFNTTRGGNHLHCIIINDHLFL